MNDATRAEEFKDPQRYLENTRCLEAIVSPNTTRERSQRVRSAGLRAVDPVPSQRRSKLPSSSTQAEEQYSSRRRRATSTPFDWKPIRTSACASRSHRSHLTPFRVFLGTLYARICFSRFTIENLILSPRSERRDSSNTSLRQDTAI